MLCKGFEVPIAVFNTLKVRELVRTKFANSPDPQLRCYSKKCTICFSYRNDEFGCTSFFPVFIGKEVVSFVSNKVRYFAKLMNFS
jgi:hypothetical protein